MSKIRLRSTNWRLRRRSAFICLLQLFLSLPHVTLASRVSGPVIPIQQSQSLLQQSPVWRRLAQATRQPLSGESPQSLYAVEGLAIGTRLSVGSAAYRKYQCTPSNQFEGFIWCTKKISDREQRGNFTALYSILHAPDGTVVYANRFQAPAFWAPTEVDDDIKRYSRKIGAQPNIIKMPTRPGLPKGTIATWGKVTLQPLDRESLKLIAEGKVVKQGLLVDFIGDFSRSAREELPVYRISGSAGFVWIASYDEAGRGTIRFSAVDASAYSTSEERLQSHFSNTTTSPGAKQDDSLKEQLGQDSPQLAYAPLTANTIEKSQLVRDALFKTLKASATRYTFDYVVINLPPGTLPGIDFSVPVSHIRYNSTVFFAFDKSSLEVGAETTVLDLAKTIMKDKAYRSILVVGHTDSTGTDEYNFNLSKARAATVALTLRTAGILDKFLGVVPMGEAQPLSTNSTPQGRAFNRRVEFFMSDIPAATKAAIEHIKFNPCYRNDHEPGAVPKSNCTGGPMQIPVYPASGEGRPSAVLDLSRSALPETPHIFREPLPNEPLQRPSIKELQSDK